MEEHDLEPCDLFVYLGMLVVEGRTPGLTGRGYGEGPHCLPISGQNRHRCDPQDPQCSREEHFRKHMMLLWRNCIPMSIEVLLCPDCCQATTPAQGGVESLAAPEPSHILLEQWTIQMLPKRMPDVTMAGKSLLHAVRSYLHFSQLSAWYSLSGGKSPRNIMYRICVPGEAFSNKFLSPPDTHSFPVANVGRTNATKVTVRAMPRCPSVPPVLCHLHEKESETNKLAMACALDPIENPALLSDKNCSNQHLKSLPAESARYLRDSRRDPLLGDCLLDPPQGLHMYPKRYQSPSRSGSPVMETPEHLMFGSPSSREGRDVQMQSTFEGKGERSRPRHHLTDKNFDKAPEKTRVVPLKEKQASVDACVFSKVKPPGTSSDGSFYFALTPKETEEILNVLRRRTTCRPSTNYSKGKPPEVREVDEHQLPSRPSMGSVFHDYSDLRQSCGLSSDRKKRTSERDARNACQDKQGISVKENASEFIVRSEINKPQPTTASPCECPTVSDNVSRHWDGNFLQKDVSQQSSNLKQGRKQEIFPDRTTQPADGSKNVSIAKQLFHKQLLNLTKSGFHNYIDFLQTEESCVDLTSSKLIPTATDKAKFRRSLDSATSMVFHCKTGLPLTSSPAPLRKGTCFDFDSSLTSIAALKTALFDKDEEEEIETPHPLLSMSAPAAIANSSLLGSFEESVLNGRLEPVSTVEGFTAEIGASGSFCPRHITLPVTVFFYTLSDTDKVSTPYLGHINLGPKGYHVPKTGTIQVTLFNPHGTVVKMFVVMYNLSDMPTNCQTFLRQRTLYMPVGASDDDPEASKWLRYLLHLRFASSKSGRIYLHTDIRLVIFRKSDIDAATILGTYELRSFTRGPTNPKFSPKR